MLVKGNDMAIKMIKVKLMVCDTCGCHDVRRDAMAEWDITKQEWKLAAVLDQGYCEGECKGECRIREVEIDSRARK